jgi:hypothetical protein
MSVSPAFRAPRQAQTANERLIFESRDAADGMNPCDRSAARMNQTFEAANPGFRPDEGVATHRRLNAFFAISVNSPSMSMVNFSCCVCSLSDVTREVAAQPTRSAVRMETWVHAGV